MSQRELAIFAALALLPAPLAAQPADLESQPVSAREIVERSLRFETLFGLFDFGPPPNYLCLVELTSNARGQPIHVRDAWEVMSLYGETFERLIRKNGKDLAPDKARAEQARFDKAVEKRAHETPEAQAKRQKAERMFQAERDACREEFMRTFEFRLAGQEAPGGRSSWVIDASPGPNSAPRCGDLKTLSKFHLKIWIDRTEFRWARVEGYNIAPATGFVAPLREPAGEMHFASEQTRYGEDIWLRTKDQYKMNEKILKWYFPVEITVSYGGYRKFQADSRILPVEAK